MRVTLFAAVALLAAGGAVAEAIEVRAGAIVLPSNPPSSLAVTPCKGCKPRLVHTSTSSRYYVNEQEVSLDELRRQLKGRPDAFVTLLYDPRTDELRSLLAHIY